MHIATWNVNSIKARLERTLHWLTEFRPEVVCLQELKTVEEKFPFEEIRALGYEAAVFGQPAYNGVAILSRTPLTDVRRGFLDDVEDPQARFIVAKTSGVDIACAYVPNGSEVGSDKYAYKLRWLSRLRTYLDTHHAAKDPLILCGDFNVAPENIDIANPDEWKDSVLCHDAARHALKEVIAFGLFDAFREKNPDSVQYSWWDYRMLAFPKNNGGRIDHIYVTESLRSRVKCVTMHRDERKGKQPSDHIPVVVDLTRNGT